LRRGALGVETALQICAQIAQALEVAHERGVIHRDVKPSNVMIGPRGLVKVLDFGIARLLRPHEAARGAMPTSDGPAAGTLPYMSPEQLLEGRVDARTDLYSLGVVLYHMAAGRLPFENNVALVLANQIINSTPPPPSRFRADLSPRLRRSSSLSRRARAAPVGGRSGWTCARRPARSRRRATRAIARRGASGRSRLPLDLARPGAGVLRRRHDRVADRDLAQIGALRVISRTTAMQYKGVRKSLPEIARELKVDAIVEGAVFRAGDRVRITVQLIEASKDQHLWAQSYERDVGDVLSLQGELARAIAAEVRVKLTPGEQERLGGSRAVNPRAYEAYLRGRHCWNKRINSEVRRAVEYFQEAIEADPSYAAAYAGLADAYNILADIGTVAPLEAAARARAATSRALDLDPRLAEAHTSRAFIRFFFD
jgi:tetratricopeptide (TPR) repeat protein